MFSYAEEDFYCREGILFCAKHWAIRLWSCLRFGCFEIMLKTMIERWISKSCGLID